VRLNGTVFWVTAVGVSLIGALFVSVGWAGREKSVGVVAFLRDPPDGFTNPSAKGPDLFTIKANGTGLRRLTPPGSSVLTYQWSPDGRLIAYLDREHNRIGLVGPDGTGRRRLLVPGSRLDVGLSWSPDGKALAVLAHDPSDPPLRPQNRIYVVPVDGRGPRRLRSGASWDPAWSPTGDEIAYTSPSGTVWIIRSDGGKARRIAGWKAGVHTGFGLPSWSPDGKSIALGEGRYDSIYLVNADSSNLRRLTNHAYNEYGFAWSPDDRRILYGREKREGIYVIDANGQNDHRLTSDSPLGSEFGALSWAPDGRSIAYQTDRTGNGDIYVIGADGHNKVQLTRSLDIDLVPSWEPQ
jgi:TolB protein